MHWATKYIGIPYAEGARGPHFFDCWGIIQQIYWNEKRIVLPELPGLNAHQFREIHGAIEKEAKEGWKEVEQPTDGCVVAMSTNKAMHHVGVYVNADGGKILHSSPGRNTVAETLKSLKLRGMKVVKFYQHIQWPG